MLDAPEESFARPRYHLPPDYPDDDRQIIWTFRDKTVSSLCKFFYKLRYWIIVFWVILTIACVFPAMKLRDNTSDDNPAPVGTAGAKAKDFQKKYFFESTQQDPVEEKFEIS